MDMARLKPFDLEKAKAGKPFGYINSQGQLSTIEIVKYLGTKSNGSHVYEIRRDDGSFDVSWSPSSALRMLPEVKKYKLLLIRDTRTGSVLVWPDTENSRTFVKDRPESYTIVKEVEIEYEDPDS